MATPRLSFLTSPKPLQYSGKQKVVHQKPAGVLTNRPSIIYYDTDTDKDAVSAKSKDNARATTSDVMTVSSIDISSHFSEDDSSVSDNSSSPGGESSLSGSELSSASSSQDDSCADRDLLSAQRSNKETEETEGKPGHEVKSGNVGKSAKPAKKERIVTREELLAEMDSVRVNRLKKEPYENCFVRWKRG